MDATTPRGGDLAATMAMLDATSVHVRRASSEASEATAALEEKVVRARHKSRELEEAIFGMGLTDVRVWASNTRSETLPLRRFQGHLRHCSRDSHPDQPIGPLTMQVEKLRDIFKQIDTDGSGTIDQAELGVALKRAGKDPSDELLQTLFDRYDVDDSKTLEFAEYQLMLKDWNAVKADIDREKARRQAAIDEAAPGQWPSGWGSPRDNADDSNRSDTRDNSKPETAEASA